MTYATLSNGFGHHVCTVIDGKVEVIASCGTDLALAERFRDLLDHEDRIRQLLERHGLVDVPVGALPEEGLT